MLALLNGDAGVDIVSLTTKYQQRRLECTDPEVLACLKEAIIKHPSQKGGIGGRYTYGGCFKFKGGGTFEGIVWIGTNGFEISVGRHPDPDLIPTHSILLIQPVPAKVKLVFDFFDEPWQEAAGSVLILESGKPTRRERDESLVAK